MRHRGYIAAVISKRMAKRLRKLSKHPQIYCNHVTVAYRPDEVTWAQYSHLIGKRIRFKTVAIYTDHRGQAITVMGVPSEKARPHITMSCASGVQPDYSNKLLAENDNSEPHQIEGFARIEFIRFGKKA